MTYRDVDNQINRINKRLESVRINLGFTTELYGRLSSIVANALGDTGLIKIERGATQIRRGKSVVNRDPDELAYIVRRLNDIESALRVNSLAAERKKLRAAAKELEYKPKGKWTRKDYQNVDRMLKNAQSSLENSLDYLYTYAVGSPEYAQAMDIMHIEGRRKTYDELDTVIELAEKHYERTKQNPEVGRKYGLGGR